MEIISFGKDGASPPLLLVHGSFCGAWIWEKYFIPALAEAGFRGAALSLRGHGKSEGHDKIGSFGVRDFLADIAAAAALFDRDPIVVGHSLGGYLAQRYALDREVSGLILLASPSLAGLSGASLHISMRNPSLAVQIAKLLACGTESVDARVVGEAIFKGQIGEDEMEAMLPYLQRESSRVVTEAAWPQLRMPRDDVPTLVLGGDSDDFVPASDLYYEAFYWGAEMKILPRTPHGFMLTPAWKPAMDVIVRWLARVSIRAEKANPS